MSKMTKKALAAALKALLEKKPLSKITVKDLAEECEINRHTFYYHFRDIYDLIEWIYVNEAEQYILGDSAPATWQEGLRRLFGYILENRKFVVETYLSFQKDHLLKLVHKHAAFLVEHIIEREKGNLFISQEKRRFAADFYAYALEGIIFTWVKNGMKQDPEEIIGMLSAMIEGTGKITLHHLADMKGMDEQIGRPE